MAKASATTYSIGKPNRLLHGFVIISLGVHAFVLGHIAGLYKSDAISYIELEMRAEEKPPGRSIPVPPPRHKTKPQLDAPSVKPMFSMPVEKPATPPVAPQTTVVRPSVVEPIAVPQKPDVSNSKLLVWCPVKSPPSIETASGIASSAHGSSGDYFSMVRMMIESCKQYPYAARRRQIQGRVVVRFVIEADGGVEDVSLVEASRHQLLNEAALEAVRASSPFPRPPAQLFSGPVSLEICMVFELM